MAPCCALSGHSDRAGQGPLYADSLQAVVLDTGCGSAVLGSFVAGLHDHSFQVQASLSSLPALSTPCSLRSQPRAGNLGTRLRFWLGVILTTPTPITCRLRGFDLFSWRQGKETVMIIIPRVSLRALQQHSSLKTSWVNPGTSLSQE